MPLPPLFSWIQILMNMNKYLEDIFKTKNIIIDSTVVGSSFIMRELINHDFGVFDEGFKPWANATLSVLSYLATFVYVVFRIIKMLQTVQEKKYTNDILKEQVREKRLENDAHEDENKNMLKAMEKLANVNYNEYIDKASKREKELEEEIKRLKNENS